MPTPWFDRIRLMRCAARVQRLHILPARYPQSVGEHTFGVLALLDYVYPEAPVALWRAALYHDAVEALTGDTPATAKWSYPTLEEVLRDVEQRIAAVYELPTGLSTKHKKILKFCDLMELAIFTAEELDSGDKRMALVVRNCLNALRERCLIDVTPEAQLLYELVKTRFELGDHDEDFIAYNGW